MALYRLRFRLPVLTARPCWIVTPATGRSESSLTAVPAPAVRVRMRRTTLPLRDFSFRTSSWCLLGELLWTDVQASPCRTPFAGVIANCCVLENGSTRHVSRTLLPDWVCAGQR